MTNTHLVISAVGPDKPGLVNDLSEAILECGCNIEDSRMAVLGGEFAIILLIAGSWNTVAKLESVVPGLQERLGMTITAKRTEFRQPSSNLLPYAADVVAIDHPGIVYNLAHFFSSKKINIEELSTASYRAAHTGTPMFSVHMEIGVPGDIHIADLREAFMDFCDELNLDGVLEPVKG
jgi:glycine cleavage system transcriptional repressor